MFQILARYKLGVLDVLSVMFSTYKLASAVSSQFSARTGVIASSAAPALSQTVGLHAITAQSLLCSIAHRVQPSSG
jgi:hypothetical protein